MMNDFNNFQDESQIEYENSRRSTGVSIGILIVTLLAIGFVWLVLRGSIPGLSPDMKIATQYEDNFFFEKHARYSLLVDNLGQAPSISRLTVMSTLSQTAIPETVYAPDPWTCTLQAHAVTCQTSDIVAGGESLPPIEITALVSPRASDGGADNLRICAAVNTLLDSEPGNNEICEILTLQVAETTEFEDQETENETPPVDDTMTEPATEDAIPDESNSITETVETGDTIVPDTLESTEPITETTSPEADDIVVDESGSITQTVESDDSVPLDPTEQITETITEDITENITQTVETDDTVATDTLEATEPITETTPDVGDTVLDESGSITQTVESDDSVPLEPTESLTETTEIETTEEETIEPSGESEIILQPGNPDGTTLIVPVDGKVFVPIHLLPTVTDARIAVATLQMRFDHTLLEPVTCNENPDQVWSISVCNLEYDLGLLRVSVLSMEGVSEGSRAANIEFQAIGPAGTTSPIQISVTNLVNSQQRSMLYTAEEGEVSIE